MNKVHIALATFGISTVIWIGSVSVLAQPPQRQAHTAVLTVKHM